MTTVVVDRPAWCKESLNLLWSNVPPDFLKGHIAAKSFDEALRKAIFFNSRIEAPDPIERYYTSDGCWELYLGDVVVRRFIHGSPSIDGGEIIYRSHTNVSPSPWKKSNGNQAST